MPQHIVRRTGTSDIHISNLFRDRFTLIMRKSSVDDWKVCCCCCCCSCLPLVLLRTRLLVFNSFTESLQVGRHSVAAWVFTLIWTTSTNPMNKRMKIKRYKQQKEKENDGKVDRRDKKNPRQKPPRSHNCNQRWIVPGHQALCSFCSISGPGTGTLSVE